MDDTVYLYTDGACKGNPGAGGWGVLMRYRNHEKELCGGEAETTNNRMELKEKGEASLPASKTDSQKVSEQMSLFVEETEDPVLTELRDLDIYNMTPLEVMAAVAELKKKL